jgi:hypothetical protein
MNDVAPARIGLLIDYLDEGGNYDENVLPTLQLVVDDYLSSFALFQGHVTGDDLADLTSEWAAKGSQPT